MTSGSKDANLFRERQQSFDDLAADASAAEDADRRLVECPDRADVRDAPPARANGGVGLGKSALQGQQHGDGVRGDFGGGIARLVHDCDVAAPGRLEIDRVQPHA